MQKFFQGGANLGYGKKRGGMEAYVRCYTLHLLGGGGGENDTRGGKCPSRPPLNTALLAHVAVTDRKRTFT